MDFGHSLRSRMISVPFELEEVESGKLIPGIPLPEQSQKKCGPRKRDTENFLEVLFDRNC